MALFKVDSGLLTCIMESVCQFNKFGFCKYRKRCFRKHEDKKCEKEQCETMERHLRQPTKCKFFVMYKNCKFGTFCRFDHDILEEVKDTEEIEKIKKDLEEFKKVIVEKDKEIDSLQKNLQKKVDDLEKSNGAMKKHLEEIKAENKELKTLIDSKLNCDKIEEIQNKEMENEFENEIEEISMTDETSLKNVTSLDKIKLD